MPSETVLEGSAGSAVGTDLFSSSRQRTAGYNRVITAIGLVGSANPSDAAVDLFIGSRFAGRFFNTTGGANKVPTANADMKPIRVPVPAGEPIALLIADAGATNVLAATVDIYP